MGKYNVLFKCQLSTMNYKLKKQMSVQSVCSTNDNKTGNFDEMVILFAMILSLHERFFMVCQININILPQRPPMVIPQKPTLPLCVPIQCVFSSNTTCVPPHDVFGGRGLDLYWHSGNARPLKAWWWWWCRTATPASSFLCVAWKFTIFPLSTVQKVLFAV